MKSICIRVEEDLHRRLRHILLDRDETVQAFVMKALERAILEAEATKQTHDLMPQLEAGARLRVTIRSGCLGCADAQDACEEFGYLILYKQGDQYRIDDPEDENIVCVDDQYYIESIIKTAEPME